LIDGDFHQPVCHQAFGLELPSVGLSTLLARGDAPCSVIVPSGVSNLSFLPTGPRPADPAALLSSERLSYLLNNLREQYRLVLLGFTLVLSPGVFTGYLTLLTVAALVGHSRREPSGGAAPPPRHRFAVVIPAHDEALMLPVLLRSLERLEYPRELYEIVVVAD